MSIPVRLFLTALPLAASPVFAGPIRDANAYATVTGPSTDKQHHSSPDIDQVADASNVVTFPGGGNCHGDAHATASFKSVTASCHGGALAGGGISYNSGWAVSTDTVTLHSSSLQLDEIATIVFSASYHGAIDGSMSSDGDASWFDANVAAGVAVGDFNDGIYGEHCSPGYGLPDVTPQDGTFSYQTTWQNGRALDITVSVSTAADGFAQTAGSTAQADADYVAGVIWMGVQHVYNSAGVEITDYTLLDQEGRDWRTAGGTPLSCRADFNGDGDIGTDSDIAAFFACLAGDCCLTCGTADFNNDGDLGTDADIESFFRVLAGGPC